MTQDTPMEDPILNSALRVAAVSGWTRTSMARVAEDAGLPLAAVLRRFPTRSHLLWAWGRHVDAMMLQGGIDPDPRDGARDRLFDLIMRRLDALAPHKEALRRLVPGFGGDPLLAMTVAMGLSRSMALTLEAAGLSASGPAGLLRVKGLGAVYAYTVRAWMKDDTPDMAKTMAVLDKALDRADATANTVFSRCRYCGDRGGSGADQPFDAGSDSSPPNTAAMADPA